MKPVWIDRAGDFSVQRLAAPHYHRPVNLVFPRTGVLHTTEGGWRGSFGILHTHFSPHFMLGLNEQTGKVEIGQYVPIGLMGYSLRGNDENVFVQIEMIGYAEETPWLPGKTKRNPTAETLD